MTQSSIRILDGLWKMVWNECTADTTKESAGFLTANYFKTPDRIVFIGEKLIPARSEDYLRRGELHLQVSPLYISRVLNVAEVKGSSVIMAHSHPFETGTPTYSPTDDYGEALTSETISKCLKNEPPVGSLLFGLRSVAARMWDGASKKCASSEVTVLSPGLIQRLTQTKSISAVDDLVDRQINALGSHVQNAIESLRVGVVGVGGTGSSVAEQLTRMGVRDLVLVDPDVFEASNWSRMYGSTIKHTAKRPAKVELVELHLKTVQPQVTVKAIHDSVMRRHVLEYLAGCDVIFSCLDRHAPRAVLNELSYQCFVPVFDVGVGLTRRTETNSIMGAVRATVVGPALPCLLCHDVVRPEMITAEHLTPGEYAVRRAQGYVGELEENVPSVVAYTTMAASMGLALFIEFMSGSPYPTQSIVFDLGSKETFRLTSSVKPDCMCQKRVGQGFRMAFSVAD